MLLTFEMHFIYDECLNNIVLLGSGLKSVHVYFMQDPGPISIIMVNMNLKRKIEH